jgi:hypothetical protein
MWEWIFLDLGTSCRWVVSFSLQPLYSRGKKPRYRLDRRLGGPQSRSGRGGEENILDPTGTRTAIPQSSSPQPVARPTALSRLPTKAMAVKITAFVSGAQLSMQVVPYNNLSDVKRKELTHNKAIRDVSLQIQVTPWLWSASELYRATAACRRS